MFFTRLNRIPRSFPNVNPVSDIFYFLFFYFLFFYFLFYPGIYVPAVSRRIRLPALLSAVSEHLSSRNTDFLFRDLLFRKSSAGGLSAITGSAALDIYMIRHTLVIAVIDALYRLAVNADGLTGMRQGITERFSSFSLLRKTFTAGAITVTGVLAAHHDVSLTAQTVLVIGTIFHNTL